MHPHGGESRDSESRSRQRHIRGAPRALEACIHRVGLGRLPLRTQARGEAAERPAILGESRQRLAIDAFRVGRAAVREKRIAE
jgi:hypothetical protein